MRDMGCPIHLLMIMAIKSSDKGSWVLQWFDIFFSTSDSHTREAKESPGCQTS